MVLFSEALADERTERLFGVPDIDHRQVRPHNRHQYLLPDMPEQIIPKILIHAQTLLHPAPISTSSRLPSDYGLDIGRRILTGPQILRVAY